MLHLLLVTLVPFTTMLIAASVVAVLISLAQPKRALLGFLLNTLDGPLRLMLRRKESSSQKA